MKLKEEEQLIFRTWVTEYFVEERKLKSNEIFERLQEDVPRLVKSIKKVSKKSGAIAYIGRCLLSKFRKEGWLTYKNGVWSVQVTSDRCAYCFKPLDELYLIDYNEHRFCNSDCSEEFEEVEDLEDFKEGYDCYWDKYYFLFDDFSHMYPNIKEYKSLKEENKLSNPLTYIELINFNKDIEEIIYDTYYDEIINDEGADGPFAWEIYRMLNIFKEELEELREVEAHIFKHRDKEKEFYSIIIDHNYLAKEGKKNKVLQKFIKKNSKYLMENCSHTWITSEREKRDQWYDELKKVIDGYFDYKNYYECDNCGAIVEQKYTRRAIDNYHYCEECFDDVKSSGGFNFREEY
jgi:hypothetical protein